MYIRKKNEFKKYFLVIYLNKFYNQNCNVIKINIENQYYIYIY